jgi:large subunit ribosomal protein L19
MFSTLANKALASIPRYATVNAFKQNRAPQFQLWAQNLSTVTSPSTNEAAEEDMLFHYNRPKKIKEGTHTKFISPRKRANKMMTEITLSAKENAHNPKVHDVAFRVGDSIELTMVSQGGVNSKQTEKIRGVVLGMVKRGLGSGVYLRDVVFGEPVDRKVPLYSPLIKDIKVLEKNFVFKGKRKIKRAKLYYLRDRLPQETRVTKY